MPDRLNHTQRHRPNGATPARPRPQARQSPPLASLQAAAGNRAVATVLQRAAGTGQLAKSTGQEQTGTSASDDLVISPVTEPEQQSREERQRKDPKGKQPAADPKEKLLAAEAEVAKRKKDAAAAATGRAGATAEVWKASGDAVDARKQAKEAQAAREKFEQEAGRASEQEGKARAEDLRLTEDADTATGKQKEAQARSQKHQGAEETARKEAESAKARQSKFEQQAEEAEQRQKAAEKDVAEFAQQAEDAERKRKAAEEEAAKFRKEVEEAEREEAAARTAAQQRAAAEEKAQEQAAKAEADAEARAAAEEEVRKWARIASEALTRAGQAEEAVKKHGGDADTAKESRKQAAEAAAGWEEAAGTARKQAKDAAATAKQREGEADAAHKLYETAQKEAAKHEAAAGQARAEAGRARKNAEAFATTAAQARESATTAGRTERQRAEEAAQARQQAASAAQERMRAGEAETGAKSAEDAAKKAEDAAKKAAAPEVTADPNPSKRQKFKETFSLTKAKQRLDPADTAVLRGSAPVGGAVRSDATKDGNTAVMHNTAILQQVETVPNVTNSLLGMVNDGRDVMSGYKGRNGQGPDAHQDDKKLKSKSAGLTQNSLMGANDVVKIVDNGVRNSGTVGGVAALGDAGGALTIGFSGIIATRDAVVIKNTAETRKKVKEHFKGVAAERKRKLQDVLDELGAATQELTQESAKLSGPPTESTEATLDAVEGLRDRIEGLRGELMGHLAFARDYVVKKQKRKIVKRAVDLTGNVARIGAGAVAILAATAVIGGPIGPAVAGGTAALALGGLAAVKGGRKANKRYNSVRDHEKWARTTTAQEGTEESEPPKMSKDGKGGSKAAAWLEAFKVTKSIKQGKRQVVAQEIYALAAGPAVPVSRNVPTDIREEVLDFLKAIKCDPARHKQNDKEWRDSLNDPQMQTAWENAIAKQIASA
ncbi:hypothetical protein ACIGO6_16425 [Streptomyces sp. NPDC053750]|uniref:hypothetical protein n=1 Tax=Streptomyces sp. NPDC053750 TaxID=3365714 RepID=UPI0037D145B3